MKKIKIKKYTEFIEENFSSVVNTPGMGAASTPSGPVGGVNGESGSGDQWPQVGALQQPANLHVNQGPTGPDKKKKKKKTKKKS